MNQATSKINFWPWLFLALAILSCSLINSPGTLDVHTWVRWLQDYLDYGPFAGYAHNKTDYPPLMVFIFYVFAKCFALLDIGSFGAVKIAILVFSLLATLLIFCWTKNYTLTALFHLSFILNTVCLGYADIILSCFLIFSLWQLQKRNIATFATLFSLAVFIKWQVLIISPFLFLYLLHLNKSGGLNKQAIIKSVVLPSVIITSLVIVTFGFNELLGAFTWAFHHPWLSGYALNAHWVLTFAYQAFSPETFGGLNNGEISYIRADYLPTAFLLARLLFISGFCYILFLFSRANIRFETMLAFSLAGYLLYFTFNTGVHENHLFLAFVLSLLLSSINSSYLSLTLYIALAFNINMLFFYGMDGQFHFSRVIQGLIDPTLVFALLNTVLFSYACYSLISINKK